MEASLCNLWLLRQMQDIRNAMGAEIFLVFKNVCPIKHTSISNPFFFSLSYQFLCVKIPFCIAAPCMLIRTTLQKSGLMSAGPGRPVWALAALLVGAALLAVTSTSSSSGKKVAQTALAHATAAAAGQGTWCAEEMLGFHSFTKLLSREGVDVWFCSLIGSIAVGLSGIFPLLVIPIEAGAALKTEGKAHL